MYGWPRQSRVYKSNLLQALMSGKLPSFEMGRGSSASRAMPIARHIFACDNGGLSCSTSLFPLHFTCAASCRYLVVILNKILLSASAVSPRPSAAV